MEERPQRHELNSGDSVFVPAWTEHQVCNEAAENDAIWILIQSGSRPVGANLTDWGGAESSTRG